jgi:peptidoglycan/xylan/chitin deacetylase (PgdA/CDA1 family)
VSRIIPVLLYHSVSDDPRTIGRRFAVAPARFESHLDAIDRAGCVTLRISELAAGLRGEVPLPDRAAAITFDDGFADTWLAVAALRRRGHQSTVYITSGEIGGEERLMPSQVNELAHMPLVEVGAHGVHHRYLDELSGGKLTYEIRQSKLDLEELTRGAVQSFAYPHGAYDRRVRDEVIRAGYTSAASVKNAVSHSDDDPFAIARWTVTAGTAAGRIAEVLRGERAPVAWSRERVRTRAYRIVRRRRWAGRADRQQ